MWTADYSKYRGAYEQRQRAIQLATIKHMADNFYAKRPAAKPARHLADWGDAYLACLTCAG
jgi:hypothetical protein